MKKSPNILAHSLLRRIGLSAILVLSASGFSHAASFHSTWTGGGDGTSWSDAGNWTTANSPQDGGSDIYHAWVDHGAGNLFITTSSAVSTRGLTLTQGVGGSTTLKLGGKYQVVESSFANGSGVFNTSGSAAGVVFDLNGHEFTTLGMASSRHNFGSASYTIKSSAADGSGLFVVRSIAATANIAVQDNVTIRLTVDSTNTLSSATWSLGSTLELVAVGAQTLAATNAVQLGHLVVGSTANSGETVASINNTNITVGGDVSLLKYGGTESNTASRLSFLSSAQRIRVKGNFTDYATDNSSYSSSSGTTTGTISFVGGAAQEKVVSIGRTGLINHFQVGDADDAGNIRLAQKLTTTGSFVVDDSSRLNVGEFTLQSGAFTAEEGATIGFELGGVINTTTLTLSSFNLELLGDWSSYESGEDVLLFSYTSLVGTPTLGTFTGPEGFSFGSIYASNGGVYLEMDVIPEPATWALLGIAGAVLARQIRRRA